MNLLLTAAIAGLSFSSHPSPGQDDELLIACSAPLGDRPERAILSIAEEEMPDERLAILRVTVKGSGAFMRVYHDAASERIARARAACLGEQIAALSRIIGDGRRDAEWSSVVFTQDADYVPPRGAGVTTRWTIEVAPDGTLGELAHRMLVSTMPHEQVHGWQRRNDTSLPRWLAEGHASWIASKIAPSLDPVVAARVRREDQRSLARVEQPIDLAVWGSVRPKREAILRQVSPEDRARMEADPNYSPSGSFSFTSDDFELDMSNEAASYPLAEAVFEGLEDRHGAAAVHAWMSEITSAAGRLDETTLSTSLARHFDERPSDLLAPRPRARP